MDEIFYSCSALMLILALLYRCRIKSNYLWYIYGLINVLIVLISVVITANNYTESDNLLLIVRSLYVGIVVLYYVTDFTGRR